MSEFIKKPEKIASAIYLITSFFNDNEPLKWKLRTLASELISFGMLIKDKVFREREVASLKTRNIVLEIISFLSVAKNVGLMSDTNHSILHQELVNCLNLLELKSEMTERNGNIVLPSNFFGTEVMEDRRVEKIPEILLKDKNESTLNDKGHNLREFGAVSVKKNTRQSTIIAILKRKKEIMIKDISPLIGGCSEKTIQRELSAMVEAGVLRKMGEKRWSRYSLAQLPIN